MHLYTVFSVVTLYTIDARGTVPLKSKLTVLTQSLKLDSLVSNMEMNVRVSRDKDQRLRIEHRASRNVQSCNMQIQRLINMYSKLHTLVGSS